MRVTVSVIMYVFIDICLKFTTVSHKIMCVYAFGLFEKNEIYVKKYPRGSAVVVVVLVLLLLSTYCGVLCASLQRPSGKDVCVYSSLELKIG